jgi:hypothetical protein
MFRKLEKRYSKLLELSEDKIINIKNFGECINFAKEK